MPKKEKVEDVYKMAVKLGPMGKFGEEIISKSAYYSSMYAVNILKKRFKLGEKAIDSYDGSNSRKNTDADNKIDARIVNKAISEYYNLLKALGLNRIKNAEVELAKGNRALRRLKVKEKPVIKSVQKPIKPIENIVTNSITNLDLDF